MTAADPTPTIPGLSERYRIVRELGRGGMATVYLAEDLKHRRPVALKVMQPEIARGALHLGCSGEARGGPR